MSVNGTGLIHNLLRFSNTVYNAGQAPSSSTPPLTL